MYVCDPRGLLRFFHRGKQKTIESVVAQGMRRKMLDAMPGAIFVLRNAGNTCTHSEGSMVGSLEFCLGALNTKNVMVLGHTACGAIKSATATYLQSKTSNKPQARQLLRVGVSMCNDLCDRKNLLWTVF